MTVRKFMKLYQHYKNHFDTEMALRAKGITYSQAERLQEKNGGDGEWL